MAKKIKDKYDLLTLAIKGQLIGNDIHFEDAVKEVSDYYIDYATGELHVEFVSGGGTSLDLRQKYVVSIPDTYTSVQSKKKVKKAKKKK